MFHDYPQDNAGRDSNSLALKTTSPGARPTPLGHVRSMGPHLADFCFSTHLISFKKRRRGWKQKWRKGKKKRCKREGRAKETARFRLRVENIRGKKICDLSTWEHLWQYREQPPAGAFGSHGCLSHSKESSLFQRLCFPYNWFIYSECPCQKSVQTHPDQAISLLFLPHDHDSTKIPFHFTWLMALKVKTEPSKTSEGIYHEILCMLLSKHVCTTMEKTEVIWPQLEYVLVLMLGHFLYKSG